MSDCHVIYELSVSELAYEDTTTIGSFLNFFEDQTKSSLDPRQVFFIKLITFYAMLKSLLKMKATVGFKRLPNATSLILTLKMPSPKQDKGNWSWQKLKHFLSTT